MKERRVVLLLGAAAFLLYAFSAPSVVNGDGLGYLRPLKWNPNPAPVPGHLLYLPLLALLRRLSGGRTLEAARLVNALAGAATVVLAYGAFRRLVGGEGRAALFGAIGLACSWGVWAQAADVETYALALACLTAAVFLLSKWQGKACVYCALGAGVSVGAATLFHVENVLFFPCLAVWLLTGAAPRRVRRLHAGLAVASGGLVVAATYAAVAFGILGKTPAQAWTWFRGAGHGFVYLIRPYNLTDALQGLARALVHAPYVHEADPAVVIGQLFFGAAVLAAVTALVIVRRKALPPLPYAALAAWGAPYLVLGLLFFGTDPERWVFLLPLLWLLFSAASPGRLGVWVAATLLALNFVTAALPGLTDVGPRWRARAVESVVDEGDLVVFPGHDWDEMIGFYDERNVRVFPLTYFVATYGVEGALAKLEGAVRSARARGGQAWAVRVFEEDPGPRGWDELALIHFPRREAVAWLRGHFQVTPLEPIRGIPVFRLEEPSQKSEGSPPAASESRAVP